ncbi:hypothetical protein DsansV1_C06g0064081 [Dioscorea sansibarensis]
MDSSLSHFKSKIAATVSLCYLTFTSSDSKDRELLILFLILSLRRVGDRVARFPPCVVFVWSSSHGLFHDHSCGHDHDHIHEFDHDLFWSFHMSSHSLRGMEQSQ